MNMHIDGVKDWSIWNKYISKKSLQQKVKKCVKAEVVFGASSKNCFGAGICEVLPVTTSVIKRKHCQSANCILTLDDETLRIVIQEKDLCNKAKIKFFSTPFFYLQEDFQLPEFVKEKLKFKNSIIPAGLYTVIKVKSLFYIVFR